MTIDIIYILIGLAVGFGIGYWIGRKKAEGADGSDGDNALNSERTAKRKMNLEKTLGLFNPGTEITNDDVQAALGVSDSAATDYLSTLEKEGKIIQIGADGRFVKYRLK